MEFANFRTVVLADGEAIHGVRPQTDEPVAADEISRKLNFVVDNDIAGQRFVPGRVIWSSPQHRETQDAVYERLQAAGEVTEVGEGQVALCPLFQRHSDWVDERLAEIVRDEILATVEHRFPTLHADTGPRCGRLLLLVPAVSDVRDAATQRH